MIIKLLGYDCMDGIRLECITNCVLTNLGVTATLEKVPKRRALKQYAIAAAPGLIINEDLVCAGRTPNVAEVTAWIVRALAREQPLQKAA